MKQIISQHGWGFDQSFWDNYKFEFQKNNWSWQDNERGYFSKKTNQSNWIKNSSEIEVKMIVCHSFGFHLLKKRILVEATHVVLINSFNSFLPLGDRRGLILRSLKRMEKKILKSQTKNMLKEFIDRSFMPNIINSDLQNIFYRNLESLNSSLLLEDLKKLYRDKKLPDFLNKNCEIIFIQSNNDFILDKNSNNSFFELLCKINNNKPTLIKLSNQGHCLTNFNLYEIINSAVNN